ncbi:superoxide dismutase family protein [Actinomadura decatromicini]|uniref:Superoxide dismutase family protein n=2 Tax=Actinomadura decatromicini TaxID=2604572 RepID=A0A5D3FMA5_9ACTN|nr:superoxide dismutase family protein [Actinomadura decatromicini]
MIVSHRSRAPVAESRPVANPVVWERNVMRPSVRAAAPLAVAGAAVIAFANPAMAHSCPDRIVVKGPSYVYDQAYKDVKTRITVTREENRTEVRLYASGFPKDAVGKTFGVHVHVNKCGPLPADAGPHYQNPDAKPDEPMHSKEIWLDATVNEDGVTKSGSIVNWRVAKGAAGALVIHAKPTNHDTGDAGARNICTTVPF